MAAHGTNTGRGRRALARAAMALTLSVLLGAPLGAGPAEAREPQGAVRTFLGGSFFPFARSFPPPSKRCLEAAEKLRRQRDRNILNPQDALRLRRIGCNGAATYR